MIELDENKLNENLMSESEKPLETDTERKDRMLQSIRGFLIAQHRYLENLKKQQQQQQKPQNS